MPSTFDAAAGMAVWDEDLWNEFEAALIGPHRQGASLQRPARKGAHPPFWMALAIAGLVWLI